MLTYVRSLRPGRTARWIYDEVDDEGTALRHIEMRAGDGIFLVADAVPSALPSPGADAQTMTADDFAALWRSARLQLDGRLELELHEIRPRTAEGLPVVVRCIGGVVRVGSRLDRVRATGEQLAGVVARIVVFDRDVAWIAPPQSALLIVTGTESARIRAGQQLDGHTR